MRRYLPAAFVFLAALTVLGTLATRLLWQTSAIDTCQVCNRAVHEQTRTVAEFEGRREVFCCPACALTAHKQSGRQVHVTRLTDFLTGSPLAPASAYVVRESDTNLCTHAHVIIDADKHASGAHFDRCSPSLLAFATQQGAARFAAAHGGTVVPYPDLAAAFAR